MKNPIKVHRELEDKLRQMKRFHPIKIGVRAIQAGTLVGLLGLVSSGVFVELDILNQVQIVKNSRNVQEFNESIEKYRKRSTIDDYARASAYTALGGTLLFGAGVVGTTQYISRKKQR